MSFFSKLFQKKKTTPTDTIPAFWDWFKDNSDQLFESIKRQNSPDSDFIRQLGPKLNELKLNIAFMGGMEPDGYADLTFTADGDPAIFPFVERLHAAAPAIPNWKFTCFKQSMGTEMSLEMGGMSFSADSISFVPNENPNYPDLIEINFIYKDFDPKALDLIYKGVYIFIEIVLGELDFATKIDRINIVGPEHVSGEPISVEKLKAYLDWREKEFVEKYDDLLFENEEEDYAVFEGQGEQGKPAVAVANVAALKWDHRVSHPWLLEVEMEFKWGQNNGMPNSMAKAEIDSFESDLGNRLTTRNGCIEVGRQTYDGMRFIYFACKDFRLGSKFVRETVEAHQGKLNLSYRITKDKYWFFAEFLENALRARQ